MEQGDARFISTTDQPGAATRGGPLKTVRTLSALAVLLVGAVCLKSARADGPADAAPPATRTELSVCVPEDSEPYSALVGTRAARSETGFDVALLRALARRMDRELRLVWFESGFDREGNLSLEARALLAAHACDAVAAIPLYGPQLQPMIADKARTPDYPGAKPLRQRPYQQLVPVQAGAAYRANAMVVVSRDGIEVHSMQALHDYTVAVRAGSMASMALGSWRGGLLGKNIRGVNQIEDVLGAVESGRAQTALVDISLWDRYRREHPATPLKLAGYTHPVQVNIGVMMRSDEPALFGQLEAAMSDLVHSDRAPILARDAMTSWIAPVEPAVHPLITIRDFTVEVD